MHCLMIMVWCNFDQIQTKVMQVIPQNLEMLTEWRTGWKLYRPKTPFKHPFCGVGGGYKNLVTIFR